MFFFFFSSRRRHTRSLRDWSSDVCSSDLLALVDARHFESHMRANPAFERRIEIRSEVRGEDHDAVERFQFAQQDVDGDVRLALIWQMRDARGSPSRDCIRFIEKK